MLALQKAARHITTNLKPLEWTSNPGSNPGSIGIDINLARGTYPLPPGKMADPGGEELGVAFDAPRDDRLEGCVTEDRPIGEGSVDQSLRIRLLHLPDELLHKSASHLFAVKTALSASGGLELPEEVHLVGACQQPHD